MKIMRKFAETVMIPFKFKFKFKLRCNLKTCGEIIQREQINKKGEGRERGK